MLGIDFGTSFSSVALLFHGQIKIVQDESGNTNIPSVVCFREKEKVGAGANFFRTKYPKNTIYEIKRVLVADTMCGCPTSEESLAIQYCGRFGTSCSS